LAAEGTADSELLEQTQYTAAGAVRAGSGAVQAVGSLGLEADLLLGHSIGELAAAHLAGVLSLEDACTLVAARATLMQQARADGAMYSLAATEHEVRGLLPEYEGRVAIGRTERA